MAKGSETGGCLNCYAARMHARNLPGLMSPTTGKPLARILESGPRWTGEVALIEKALRLPIGWKKPKRIFVNSQSDLFHEDLPFEAVDRIFAVMAAAWWHTYQILTKRHKRMLAYFTSRHSYLAVARQFSSAYHWPLRNVWLGVSVEDQKTADMRIPLLLQTPAALRFVSYEPALGPINFRRIEHNPSESCGGSIFIDSLTGNALSIGGCQSLPSLGWIIAGGESGPGARFCNPDWIKSARNQCSDTGVPFFFKQWGNKAAGHLLDGQVIQQFPTEAA